MELSLPSAFLRSSIVPAVWYLATSAGYRWCWTADKIVAAIRIILVMLAPASVRPLVPSLASLAPALLAAVRAADIQIAHNATEIPENASCTLNGLFQDCDCNAG